MKRNPVEICAFASKGSVEENSIHMSILYILSCQDITSHYLTKVSDKRNIDEKGNYKQAPSRFGVWNTP